MNSVPPADPVAIPEAKGAAEILQIPGNGSAAGPRFHAFDFLRAAMMMLGIVMHGVQCYTRLDVYMWPFKDVARSHVFDFIINWVHIFRMPVFFVMAGFFFALLATRRGVAAAIVNRAKRILLPFLLGWIVLAPIIIASIGYLRNGSWPEALALATTGSTYWKYGPLHLWFLQYLLFIYPVILVADWSVRRGLGARGLSAASRLFRQAITSRWRALFIALVTAPPMASMGGWLTTPGGFAPNVHVLLTYLLFFGFGWLLYFNRECLDNLKRGGGTEIVAGIGLSVLGYAVLVGAVPVVIWKFAGPLATWLFIFGFISIFLRHLERPVRWIRYFSDSSYWLYLIHVPVLIWVQVLIAPVTIPVLLKGLLALAIALPLMLASYQVAVRGSWVGVLLNGRRAPRDSARR